MKRKLVSILLVVALCMGLAGTALAVTLTVTSDPSIKVVKDGEEISLENVNGTPVNPFNLDGTIYLPIRAISEALGFDVDWQRDGNQVILTSNCPTTPAETEPAEQEFLVPQSQAQTYINPLPLDYQMSSSENKGVVSENPFMIGQMIGNVAIPNDPLEKITHMRFQDMFRGTASYLTENDTRSSADPAAFYYNDTWYIYGSNGSMWKSADFVNWEFYDLSYVYGMAPSIAVRTDENGKDTFYLAGNGTHLWSADSPEGPFTDLGEFTYNGKSFVDNLEDGIVITKNNDVNIFVDDDGRMYLYWGMGPYIMGAEMNVDNPTELITEPKIIIEYDNSYKWQNFGQNHQDYENGFPEGAWMVKIDGTYYLTWATSGTQYDSYTMGCYQSTTGPLDGFELQEKEIINQTDSTTGAVRGGGHGSIVVGPNDTLWCFYTVNVGYEGDMERMIGCDPAMIDSQGNLVVPHLSELPQYVPGTLANPAEGNECRDDLLTLKQGYAISSYAEGRHPVYANDDSGITWWQPADDDEEPFYLVSFKGNYNVDSFRILWKEINKDRSEVRTEPAYINYKVEVFNGTSDPTDPANADCWTTLYEKTDSSDTNTVQYFRTDEPILGQFVKITITDWSDNIYPGLVEFSVFGNSIAKP